MLERIEADSTAIVADQAVGPALAALGSRASLGRGGLDGRSRPKELVVLRTLDGGEPYPGYGWKELRNARRERADNGVLCQTAIEIQSAVGCPFDCTYCPYGSFVSLCVDVEEFVERVASLAISRRSQSLYKLNNRTDTLALEPEYGLAGALVERFARLDGKYLMLYSKGDAIEHLERLDHGGKTVASFTLTPEPVAALLEVGAPPPAARIAAMGRLFAAGYPVRVRLSPIVPLIGWRDAYQGLIERIAEAARPEMVTLWTLSMIDVEDLHRIVPPDELDPQALEAARAAADRMRGKKGAPLPPEVRGSIYREIAEMLRARLPATRVALCLETPEVWDALSDVLSPRCGPSFSCNCGPRAVPAGTREVRTEQKLQKKLLTTRR